MRRAYRQAWKKFPLKIKGRIQVSQEISIQDERERPVTAKLPLRCRSWVIRDRAGKAKGPYTSALPRKRTNSRPSRQVRFVP
jgi:hypothetical protein